VSVESPSLPPNAPMPRTATFCDFVRSDRIRKISIGVLVVLGAAWVVVRFCGLGASPPGFFMDEATPATNAMCLAETGRNLQGERWPLYSPAAGGGSHTLVLLAFDTVWIKIFGTSREAFRAVSGFFILLTSLGLVLIAKDAANLIPASSERSDRDSRSAFPWLVLFAALVSPWAFHFSRIAWDAPVASAFMIWSVAAVLRSHRADRASFGWALFAGACAALSMIAYAPLRAVVPLVLPLEVVLLWLLTPGWADRWRLLRNMLLAAVTATALLASTIRMLLDGKINERMNNIVIWRPDWMHEHAVSTPHWRFLVETFLDNLLAHLKPSFLFFDGDAGLRHSPHISGQLSPIDLLALVLITWALILATVRTIRGPRQGLPPSISLSETTRGMLAIALAAGLCWLFGLVPAALTFDAIPHAIRSLAAWPYIALFTGAILTIAWSRLRWFAPGLALLALAYSLYYFPTYFHAYDGAAKHWFMRDMTDVIAKERREQPGKTIQQIVSDHFGYSYYYDEIPWFYLMSEGHLGCAEAGEIVHALRKTAE
jgi:hypothetical protein